jgi:hypothetical protein
LSVNIVFNTAQDDDERAGIKKCEKNGADGAGNIFLYKSIVYAAPKVKFDWY